MTDFATAWARTVGHEGDRLSTDPNDRGNWTSGRVGVGEMRGSRYGISAAAFPDEDIPNLTVDRARDLARAHYWTPLRLDVMPPFLRADLFDIGYHAGPAAAVRLLQLALRDAGIDPALRTDGVIGPRTLAAAERAWPGVLVLLWSRRLEALTDAWSWPAHGRGWTRRVALDMRRGFTHFPRPEEVT